jgi:hypothetical protein
MTDPNQQDLYSKFIEFFNNEKQYKKIYLHKMAQDEIFYELLLALGPIETADLETLLLGENDELMNSIYILFNFDLLFKEFPYDKNFYNKNCKILEQFQDKGFFQDEINLCGSRKYFIFVKVIMLFIEDSKYINLEKNFDWVVTRKFVKHSIMTYFYGSSSQSRRESYKQNYIELCTENNIELQNIDLFYFAQFALQLDILMVKWINKFYPQSLILIKALRKVCGKKKFDCNIIQGPHADWTYNPFEEEKYSKSILNKDYKLKKYSEIQDFVKLSNSYIANYAQYCDALICADIVKQLRTKNIYVQTQHDCFAVAYCSADQLNEAIYNAYINFIKADYLKKHFQQQPLFFREIEKSKLKYNILNINIDLIPKDASTLVKME